MLYTYSAELFLFLNSINKFLTETYIIFNKRIIV